MSGGIYPKAKALVPGILRSLSSIVLILIAAGCVYLSFAVPGSPSRRLVEVLDDLRRRGAFLLARGGMAAPTVSQLRRPEPDRGGLRLPLARGPERPSRVLVDLDDPCRRVALLLARGGMAAPGEASRGLTRVPADLILRRGSTILAGTPGHERMSGLCRVAFTRRELKGPGNVPTNQIPKFSVGIIRVSAL